MSEINAPVTRKKKTLSPVLKKKLVRIDLTPMVDLGFLLITFFMFATTLAEPKAMKLTMPTGDPDSPVEQERGLVVIVGKEDRIYSYEASDPEKSFSINSFGNIRKFRELIANKKAKTAIELPGEHRLVVSIKCAEEATYGNFIDILDEMKITAAGIAVVDKVSEVEKQMIGASEKL